MTQNILAEIDLEEVKVDVDEAKLYV